MDVASAQDLPFEDNRFDIVMGHFMLYHVPEPTEAAAELRRVLKPDGTTFAATLGQNHMRQLDAAVYHVHPHDLLLNRGTTRAFSLENGADILRSAFGDVTMHRYDCDLSVTAVQPLVDYAKSMFPESEFTPEQIATLSETFSQEIAANGAFHITKDTAMFVARGHAGA
jgi:SAM-dependent methyltransferase